MTLRFERFYQATYGLFDVIDIRNGPGLFK